MSLLRLVQQRRVVSFSCVLVSWACFSLFFTIRKLEEKLGAKLDGEELLPVVWGQKHIESIDTIEHQICTYKLTFTG